MAVHNRHAFAVLAYGNSPHLEECILSLKNQTVPSDVYIATSTPSNLLDEISNKYRIPIRLNSRSHGIASDWSYAYDQCEAEYVTLAHQDDVYFPRYTEYCLNAATRYADDRILLIFTGYSELVNDKVRKSAPHLFIKRVLLCPFLFKRSIRSIRLKRLILSFGSSISCPTVTYHKGEIGSFRFSEEFTCNMDWDAWLRMSLFEGSFIYVSDDLVAHRINDNTQTSLKIRENVRQKEDNTIFRRLWPRPIAVFLGAIYTLATKFNEAK